MEGFGEPNHLKGVGLSPIIELIPEGDGHIDLSQWLGLFSEHDAVERHSGWAEACPVDAHLVKRLGVHDVEAAASIHQHFGEPLCADDWVDHEQISSQLWDAFWVVSPIKGYGGF